MSDLYTGMSEIDQGSELYEGKEKKIFSVEGSDSLIIIHYKDDTTAFNGEKKGQIEDIGILNNQIASGLFELLERSGVDTHFIHRLSDRDMLCKKVRIIPLIIMVHNFAAGGMAERLGIAEGTKLKTTVFELFRKNNEQGSLLLNDYHAVAIGASTFEEINEIRKIAFKINEILSEFFIKRGIKLIDLKLEFGRVVDISGKAGGLVLADEISPDTCRFWDAITNEKLDKDRFRSDMGNIKEAYAEIMNRISG